MAINYPGPYEIEYNVLVSSIPHLIRVNCVATPAPTPGSALNTITLQTRSGTPANAQTCVDGLWNLIRAAYNTGVTCQGVTLWRYPVAGSFVKTFVSAGAVTTPAGAAPGATTLAHQATLSFRTANGGIMKLTLLETAFTALTRQVLVANAAGATEQKIAAYLISGSGWAIARDDSFPITPLYGVFGQNEAIFKARYR